MATEAERSEMQVDFDTFIANAPKRALEMRENAKLFTQSPKIVALMHSIADHQAGYAQFVGARIELAQAQN